MATAQNDYGTALEKGGTKNGTSGKNATGNVLTNDLGTGTKTVVSVSTDTGTPGVVGKKLVGDYGTLTLSKNGTYTYVIDDKNADVQALNVGDTRTDSFYYTMSASGEQATAVLTITIQGANDAPVAIDDTASVLKRGESATGNVLSNDTDVDTSSGSFEVVSIRTGGSEGKGTAGTVEGQLDGLYGTLTINSDGSYSYQVNESNAKVSALKAGQTLTDSFNYTMSDGSLTDIAKLTITINGFTDPAVANNDTGIAIEKGGTNNGTSGSNATGNVLTNDLGAGTKFVVSVRTGATENAGTAGVIGGQLVGEYGTLTLNKNGTYTYVIDDTNALVQGLNVGQILTDSFNYTMSAGGLTDIGVLTLTIQGANDAPVAVNDTATLTKQEGLVSGSVLTNDTDVDTPPDALRVTQIRTGATEGAGTAASPGAMLVGQYGTLVVGETGSYVYEVDPTKVLTLIPGTMVTDEFNYTVSDGSLSDIGRLTVTVSGGPNTPPVANDDAGTAIEKGGTNNGTGGADATGNVLSNDTDLETPAGLTVAEVRTGAVEGAGTPGTVGVALAGAYGSLVLNADGTYTYTVNETNAQVQALNVGQILADSFNYTASDGNLADKAVLTITIEGANDAPVAVDDTGTAVKGGANASGNVLANDTDVDTAASAFAVTQVRKGATENTGTAGTVGAALAGAYGTLTLNANGSYQYDIDSGNAAVLALKPGETLTDSFNYTMSDGSLTDAAVLTITINGGTNLPPVATDDFGVAVEKGGVANASGGKNATGTVLANDVDPDASPSAMSVTAVRTGSVENAGTAGTIGSALAGAYGTLTLGANGTYTYVVNDASAAVQALHVGQFLTDSFNYTVWDGAGGDIAVLSIRINGTDDAASISIDPATPNDRVVTEAGGWFGGIPGDPSASGRLLVVDPDSGEDRFAVPASLNGTYGSFAFNAASGAWSYTLDNARAATQALKSGQTATDTLTVTSLDGSASHAISVTVNGTDDGTIALDGALGDWTAAQKLGGALPGNVLYGDVQLGTFLFAVDAGSGSVGPGTTIWLDTDLNAATGYQIFNSASGAEYNIDIGADGVARLYTGGAGQTLVGDVDYRIAADGHTAEFSLAASLLGNATAANVFADINNGEFLPASYSGGGYRIGSLPVVTVGTVSVDGSLGDWADQSPQNGPADSPPGVAFYAQAQDSTFLFAISDANRAIGADTTIWLNTDRNPATGYQIFGNTGGAEYNINIGIDGTPRLYTGAAGQTFVANLSYNYSADHHALEIALPTGLMAGAPIGANVLVDINNAAYLPSDYANLSYSVGKLSQPLPVDPSLRVAIVYSQTSADNFYSATAYGQLFMAVQSQAMQAGIPFDLLSEADLKDPAKLAGYDAIVFPGLQNVKAADLGAITNALAIASKDYGVGLITQGNFLTNDEHGQAFAGDSYARMKSLLGVTLDISGNTNGITLKADGGAHPIQNGYTAGEVVGTYTNTSYQAFRDVTGTGQTLFDQTAGGASHAAVIATSKGGNNVSFASDAIMGNNNILGQAIDWATKSSAAPAKVDVSLAMTRFTSLFQSRTDMDQSQETYDVIDQNPGIYDKMIPILQGFKDTYNFVGSYYVNIGDNPPDQITDWSVSGPYYQQLLAMGNEIGTHSYTHPEDTNVLVPTSQASAQLLALLALVDPDNPNRVDPSTLNSADRALLATSFQFQFEYSKQIIEQRLGITVAGAAVPGMPETAATAHQIIPYFDYITGGWSGVGGGFPNAFGFLTPDDLGKVYLAPNMVFDFTLIGFQKIGIEAATAEWLREFNAINAHATTPIIHFPWHDYGLTDWDLNDPVRLHYAVSMWTAVLDAAVQSGTEFVTAEDLADRIRDFQASGLTVSQTGNVITAKVTSPDAGKFALDIGDAGTQIASATLAGQGWYAWDGNKLLLPAGGGIFTATLGAPADVSHLTSLAMRAELTSVTGDGTNLAFDFVGSGDATVRLQTQGTNSVIATGADGGSISAGKLTLTFANEGAHSAAVTYGAGGMIVGTAANEVILGGSAADTIRTGGGTDIVFGEGGPDTFVFAPGSGNETIGDFLSGTDHLDLAAFGFGTAAAALGAFTATTDGLHLAIGGDTLHLLGIGAGGLAAADLIIDHQIA